MYTAYIQYFAGWSQKARELFLAIYWVRHDIPCEVIEGLSQKQTNIHAEYNITQLTVNIIEY